jgi:hypothetical protein
MKATYERMASALSSLLWDLSILAGDRVGPSGASWQDVARTARMNAEVLAHLLELARTGQHEAGITFPSPAEILDTLREINRLQQEED